MKYFDSDFSYGVDSLKKTIEKFLTILSKTYLDDMYLLNYQSVLWVNLSDKDKLIHNTIA